jgi:DNA-binding NtrC family response regulator
MTKILIIDDNEPVRSTMSRILTLAGYETVLAADGNEGLARMRAEAPDLIITDIIMPEKEGIETIRQVLAERPEAKIMAVSGGGRHGNMDFLNAARKLGAMEVLEKPFEPDELVNCVARCLQRP